jgi:hypothetical protein
MPNPEFDQLFEKLVCEMEDSIRQYRSRKPNPLVEQFRLALSCCWAAIAYDAAIARKAATGEIEYLAQGALAEGVDLDTAYEELQARARAALVAAGQYVPERCSPEHLEMARANS